MNTQKIIRDVDEIHIIDKNKNIRFEKFDNCFDELKKLSLQGSRTLIKEDLKSFLLNQYKVDKLTESEADQIIRQLEVFSSSDLYESNKAIMKLISDGFALKREDRSQKDIWVYLIDYSEKIDGILIIILL